MSRWCRGQNSDGDRCWRVPSRRKSANWEGKCMRFKSVKSEMFQFTLGRPQFQAIYTPSSHFLNPTHTPPPTGAVVYASMPSAPPLPGNISKFPTTAATTTRNSHIANHLPMHPLPPLPNGHQALSNSLPSSNHLSGRNSSTSSPHILGS